MTLTGIPGLSSSDAAKEALRVRIIVSVAEEVPALHQGFLTDCGLQYRCKIFLASHSFIFVYTVLLPQQVQYLREGI